MSGNSNISVTITHTKVARVPNEVQIRPLFNENLPECFWSSFQFPFLTRPALNGVPVFYTDADNPQFTTALSSDFTIASALSSTAWTQSLSACSVVPTGCFGGDLTMWTSDSPSLSSTDDCMNLTEMPTSSRTPVTFNISMDYDGGVINTTLSSCVRSNQDPYPTTWINAEESLLPKVGQFDYIDTLGNGIIFDNPNSQTAQMMNTMFGGGYTNTFLERIANFDKNNRDLDVMDIAAINDFNEMTGGDIINFLVDVPEELLDVIKLSSLEYEQVFGSNDTYSKYNDDNRSDLLELSSVINAGENLFYQKTDQPTSEIEILIVPNQNHHLSAFTPDMLSATNSYPLSTLSSGSITPEEYCFWRALDEDEPIRGNYINVDSLSGIPTPDEWDALLKDKIERILLTNA